MRILDRYERRSLLVTGNLSFSEWGTVFQGASLPRPTRTARAG